MQPTALLINPSTRTIKEVEVGDYDDIKQLFASDAELEAGHLFSFAEIWGVEAWADCNQYAIAPAWICKWNPEAPCHGLTLVTACLLETGEPSSCPLLSSAGFAKLVEWEDFRSRLNPEHPNQDWVNKTGGYTWSISDGDRVIASGSTLPSP
jgi:hypothetical protein